MNKCIGEQRAIRSLECASHDLSRRNATRAQTGYEDVGVDNNPNHGDSTNAVTPRFNDAQLLPWPPSRSNSNGQVTGRCARRKDRTCRTTTGIISFGSFHGYRLTSDFGARRTDSIATAYGCAGTSSGSTKMGV